MSKPFLLVEISLLVILAFAGKASCQTTPGRQTRPPNLLLKNYRPVSIYKIPYVVIKKAKYQVIDMHSHTYEKSLGDLKERIRNMDSSGIRKTVILTGAYGAQFDSLAKFYSRYPGRFILFCGFDFKSYDQPGFGPAAVKELEKCYKAGARGVGEITDKGKGFSFADPPAYGLHIDDPRMDPLLDECAKLNMPVSIHVGEPQWFYERMDSTNDGLMNAYGWRLDNQKGILTLDEELDHLARAVSRHPKTIFIACHYANQVTDLAKLGKLFDKYPNLYADISARYADVATIPRYAKAFIEKYRDRLFYGTDMGVDRRMYEITFTILETRDEHFYHINLFGYYWPLYGLGLSDKTLKRLYYENAATILKIKE